MKLTVVDDEEIGESGKTVWHPYQLLRGGTSGDSVLPGRRFRGPEHTRHQGSKECARRLRQIDKGQP